MQSKVDNSNGAIVYVQTTTASIFNGPSLLDYACKVLVTPCTQTDTLGILISASTPIGTFQSTEYDALLQEGFSTIDAEVRDKPDTAGMPLFDGSDTSVEKKKIVFVQQFFATASLPIFLYLQAAAISVSI